MTTLEGAFIREQGIEFAIIVVKPHVLRNTTEANEMIASLRLRFGRPVVLMAQDGRGTPTWYGRKDLSRFMSGVPLGAIPWKQITLHCPGATRRADRQQGERHERRQEHSRSGRREPHQHP